jgi:hypothetical protein
MLYERNNGMTQLRYQLLTRPGKSGGQSAGSAASGSFVEIVIAYPIDSPDNFGVNMPMIVANDPLGPVDIHG